VINKNNLKIAIQKIFTLTLVLSIFAQVNIFAFETDQYNLPKEPLADIGDEVSIYVAETIEKIIVEINIEINELQNCLDKKITKGCDSVEKINERLDYLRSEKPIVKKVYNKLGFGLIASTRIGSWLDKHKFTNQPARYKTTYKNSIFTTTPTNYFTISPTIKVYNVELGTDKIAHIFQQGYTYYSKYNNSLDKDLSEKEAIQKAVNWGKLSENTFYGTLVSGVYSNADLAANYAGLKFYQNLTHEIKIGETIKKPILILETGLWKFNESSASFSLKPFISNHLNEAFNHSIYAKTIGLQKYIKNKVKKNACENWLKNYPNFTAIDFDRLSENLELWHGESYGYKSSDRFVTIANTCF
jgi:hypothetical protein